MIRKFFIVGSACVLALSLVAGLIALPTARAENRQGFGLRVNLLIDSDITPLVNAAQIMRLDWVAQEVQWKTLEPQPGQYRWEKLDTALKVANARGFQIMLSVSGTPDWARPAGSNPAHDTPPADINTFAKFLATMAQRYEGIVTAYEIYPEANLATRWSSAEGISPERYTDLLKATYTAAHAANPRVIILGGGLAPVGAGDGKNALDDLSFYRRMYKAGAEKVMDGLSVHVDGHNNPPADFTDKNSTKLTTYKNNSAFYFRHYESIRKVMEENDAAEQGLWITSAGWASSTEKVTGKEFALDLTEDQQADYLIAAMRQAQTQPYVAALMLNNFNYSTTVTPNDPLALYSLIRTDWSARPAFLKLAQARQEELTNTPAALTTNVAPTQQSFTLPNWRPRQRPLFGVQP